MLESAFPQAEADDESLGQNGKGSDLAKTPSGKARGRRDHTDKNARLLNRAHTLYSRGIRTREAMITELRLHYAEYVHETFTARVDAVAKAVVEWREKLPSGDPKPPSKFPPHMSRRGGVVSGRTRRRRRGTDARNAEIVRLHGRGMSHRRIADMVGCGKSWVSKVVRESRTIREDTVVSPFTRTYNKAIKGSVDTPTRKAPKLVTTREEFESELKKLNDLEATRDEDLNSGHRSHIGRIRNGLWRSLFGFDEWWSLVFYRDDDLTMAKPCHTPLVVVPERHGDDWCSGLRKAA